MAIRINGTTITINRLNSSNITLEKINGAPAWSPAPKTKQWVYLYWEESEPNTGLGTMESSNDTSLWLWELGSEYPAPDYPVGTTVCVWDGGNTYYVYQVQEV